MHHITGNEKQMFRHAAEVMSDRIHHEPDEYTDADRRAVDHLDKLGTGETAALVVTGEQMNDIDARRLLKRVVDAELRNWVPNASQRLLHRAAGALGVDGPGPLVTDQPDCGTTPEWHVLVSDWIVGIFVRRCATCGRLYADGATK